MKYLISILFIISCNFSIAQNDYFVKIVSSTGAKDMSGHCIKMHPQSGNLFILGSVDDNVLILEMQTNGNVVRKLDLPITSFSDIVTDFEITNSEIIAVGYNSKTNKESFIFNFNLSTNTFNWKKVLGEANNYIHFSEIELKDTDNSKYLVYGYIKQEPGGINRQANSNLQRADAIYFEVDLSTGTITSNNIYAFDKNLSTETWVSAINENDKSVMIGSIITDGFSAEASRRVTVGSADHTLNPNDPLPSPFTFNKKYYEYDGVYRRMYGRDICRVSSSQYAVIGIGTNESLNAASDTVYNGYLCSIDPSNGNVIQKGNFDQMFFELLSSYGDNLQPFEIGQSGTNYIILCTMDGVGTNKDFVLISIDEFSYNVNWAVRYDAGGFEKFISNFNSQLVIDDVNNSIYFVGETDGLSTTGRKDLIVHKVPTLNGEINDDCFSIVELNRSNIDISLDWNYSAKDDIQYPVNNYNELIPRIETIEYKTCFCEGF
ncbi:hypothetical protein HZR84_00870 [Hyphobacterium sp. CCMP332]|nr:hypothetical protein HZR84_00870 [Hyphobacterium sp. CCMP332]